MGAYEIETLSELVREVQNEKTGGYDVEFSIHPNTEDNRASAFEYWLVIDVTSNLPDSAIRGQWWFDGADQVMQVL